MIYFEVWKSKFLVRNALNSNRRSDNTSVDKLRKQGNIPHNKLFMANNAEKSNHCHSCFVSSLISKYPIN